MKQFFLTIAFCLSVICLRAQKIMHPGGMHTQKQLNTTKSKLDTPPYREAYKQLLSYADSASRHPVHSLVDFSVPGYYVDAEGHRTNSRSLQSDAFDAYASALAFSLSGKEEYASNAIRFLNAWSYKNTGYSQADGSLVMAYSGTAMVMAAELLYNTPQWKAADKAQFSNWVSNVYKRACNEIRNRKNNWADWGRFGSLLSANFLNDFAEVEENIRLIKSDLADKIAEDGSMPHETRRGANGIWYTYFSLAPITAACWVVYNSTGENLFTWSQDGRSLKRALDYLYRYTLQPESWPWFEKPNRGSPNRWPGNLFEALSDIYNEQNYAAYSDPARPVSYPVHHFAWTFPTLMKPDLE